ncbi:MAG TPA: type III secretion system chaperone [Steroidobacteraceae bacterium]|nr:type III secretion system chaperone [Steroidobacteraceae bacterium]
MQTEAIIYPRMSNDLSGDESRVGALFEALGLGQIDADEDGCFVMSHDEETSLHFQIVPAADLLKVAVTVCTLSEGALARDLRVVLRANLDAPRAELPGTLSIVAITRQVLFNTVVPIVVPILVPILVPEAEDSVRPMQPSEFGALLERVLKEAFAWRERLVHELGEHASSCASTVGVNDVIRG